MIRLCCMATVHSIVQYCTYQGHPPPQDQPRTTILDNTNTNTNTTNNNDNNNNNNTKTPNDPTIQSNPIQRTTLLLCYFTTTTYYYYYYYYYYYHHYHYSFKNNRAQRAAGWIPVGLTGKAMPNRKSRAKAKPKTRQGEKARQG